MRHYEKRSTAAERFGRNPTFSGIFERFSDEMRRFQVIQSRGDRQDIR